MKKYVVIVAGGKGLRMGSEIPKQFMLLAGLPVIMHTIRSFKKAYSEISVVLVLPEPQMSFWKTLCEEYNFTEDHKVTSGGATRFHSVENGLKLVVEENSMVGIHDAVRPLASTETITRCFENAEDKGNATPIVPINDSIRNVKQERNAMVNREEYFIVQTPQVFQSKLIKAAFEQGYKDSFTDDASVLESAGGKINLVEGNFENIKITRPVDFKIAELFIGS